MATRPSPSRESSVSYPSLSQRPSLSRLSNPDVFSDDYALSSRGNSPDVSPVDSIDSSAENLPVQASNHHPALRTPTVITPSHLNTMNFSRPSSTSKRPLTLGEGQALPFHRTVSSISSSDAATQRSASISSYLSIPRVQSPYTGPAAPSQPYAMYPQVTRASSIASESTVRPIERPYVGTGGPEHPYGMYPQNTVEEEDDDHTPGPASAIPLGFPGMGQVYSQNRNPGHDLGDIVGSDGHIEQLPPYTRYADNTIAKASSDASPVPVAAIDIPLSPVSRTSDSDVVVNTGAAREAEEPAEEHNEKSKTKRRLRRKVCWGISLCVWLLVVAVIVIAATLGGVIGALIGTKQASDAAADQSPATATTTVWLDAAPLPTGVPAPNCTPGSYNMPTTNNSLHINSCIADEAYSAAWDCLDQQPVPFWIKYLGSLPMIQLGQPGPGRSGKPFSYGPQIPDLNGSIHRLSASIDKDDPSAGGAMFFNMLYNKLTVVPAHVFSSKSKRSIQYADVDKRSMSSGPVSIGEMPYFCWFNQTLLELFIYSQLSTNASAANTTAYAYPLSTTVPAFSQSTGAASTSMTAETTSSLNNNQVTSPTTEPGSLPSSYVIPFWPSSSWIPEARVRRRNDGDNDYDENFPFYPKQIRLAEKRAPSGQDVTPYCIQVEVNSDWSVCEISDTYVEVVETEPTVQESSRRWNRPRSSNDDNNLDSDCACQWYST